MGKRCITQSGTNRRDIITFDSFNSDRSNKFMTYKNIPSMKYVMVSQEKEIETFSLTEPQLWKETIYSAQDDTIYYKPWAFLSPMSSIYRNIVFLKYVMPFLPGIT
ncbi:MAG: hypothetical protein IPJ13_12915 [Saprospiraceae bacterium]|nr:hypothetical protein [Saprospiraceae bacterium]